MRVFLHCRDIDICVIYLNINALAVMAFLIIIILHLSEVTFSVLKFLKYCQGLF